MTGAGARGREEEKGRSTMVALTRDDAVAAGCVAFEAGQLLTGLRHAPAEAGAPPADDRSNELIEQRLRAAFPGDAILSEESPDSSARLDARRIWIVDPLDGTREYGEPPRDDWAVHVALVDGGTLVAGAVALPARSMVFTTATPHPVPARPGRPMRIAVSRTRPPAAAATVAEAVGGELVPMGSAGAKAMAVVRGDVDAYVHGGGQYEWDTAAPAAVAGASGLHVCRLDGSPLRFNQPDPYSPDLLICHQADAAQLLELLASALAAGGS